MTEPERESTAAEHPFIHEPVMLAEVLAAFAPIPAGVVVDATVGGGGHARAILEASALGVEMAKRLKTPILMARWEDYFDWPLEEIRAHFGIEGAPPEGAWDWTYDAVRD